MKPIEIILEEIRKTETSISLNLKQIEGIQLSVSKKRERIAQLNSHAELLRAEEARLSGSLQVATAPAAFMLPRAQPAPKERTRTPQTEVPPLAWFWKKARNLLFVGVAGANYAGANEVEAVALPTSRKVANDVIERLIQPWAEQAMTPGKKVEVHFYSYKTPDNTEANK